MKCACAWLILSLTGVYAAKTRKDLPFADHAAVSAEEHQVAELRAEIWESKEMLKKLEAQMEEAKKDALRAAEDAEKIAISHRPREPSAPSQVKAPHAVKAVKTSLERRNETSGSANASSAQTTRASEANVSQNVSYGLDACPCIGFNHLEGETVALIEGKMIKYPADLGSQCQTWDDGVHPQCRENADWCVQPWCYVDPRHCNLDVLPTMSSYMPTARYKHMPLFYSYATCGSNWGREAQVATMGQGECRCIGVNNMPGSLKFNVDSENVLYPAEAGGSCNAWDLDNHPQCAVNGSKPEWCTRKWCFVDPCSCSLSQPPKVSTYVNGTMQGKSIYYSYETCGNPDMFSATFSQAACIEKTKDACNKNAKCLWSGHSCLGKELVDKDACLAKEDEAEPEEKSNTKGLLVPILLWALARI